MKVCMIISTPFPPEEGIGNYAYNLASKLIERGHEVTIVTRGSPRSKRHIRVGCLDTFRVTFLPIYPFHVHLHGFFLHKFLNKHRANFDLVHLHSPLVPAIKRILPSIATIHTPVKVGVRHIETVDAISIAIKLQSFVSYQIEKRLFESNLITVVSRSVANALQEYGINPSNVVVLGNAVDEELFRPTPNNQPEPYVLYVGRLSHRKGLFDLIDAIRIVCGRNPQVKFVLVGKGPLMSHLNALVLKLKLGKKVQFLGFVSKHRLISLYQNASVFVIPSHYEGMPTTLLEAMSCALPVVATAVSGNLDAITNGKNGLLVPPKSPTSLANAIERILYDKIVARDLGARARETVEQGYTWDIVASKVEKCYKSLIND